MRAARAAQRLAPFLRVVAAGQAFPRAPPRRRTAGEGAAAVAEPQRLGWARMETSYAGSVPGDDAQVWDRVKTVRLIELWSQSPALFDSTCPDYRDKHQRSAALYAIASELGLQDSEIRDKMRNLRSQYAREKTHEQKSTLSPSLSSRFAYKSKWFYFSMLSFLDEFKRHVRSDSGSSRSHLNMFGNPDVDSVYSYQASLTPGTDGGDAGLDPDCAHSPQTGALTARSLPASPATAAAAEVESLSRSEGSDCGSMTSAAAAAAANRLAAADGSGVDAGRRTAGAAATGGHTGAKKRKMNARKLVRHGSAADVHCFGTSNQLSLATNENGIEELKEEMDDEEDDAVDAWRERLPIPAKVSCTSRVDDDDDDDEELFGRFIASELRKVASVRLKAVAKLRMHEALLAATVARWEHDGPAVAAAAASVSGVRQRI